MPRPRPSRPPHAPTRRTALATLAALTSLAAAPLAGCGGGGRDRTAARIRLVNASAYATLELRVDGTLRQGQVAYGETAQYADVEPDRTDTEITRPGSPTALRRLTPALGEDRAYTLLAWGEVGALDTLLLDDGLSEPEAGRARLRVVNVAGAAGALDVYLTAADDALATAVPAVAGTAAGSVAAPVDVGAGTWRLRVAAAGSKTDLRLDLPAVQLPSRGIVTLVLAPARGGVLVNALLLAQRGAITRADNTLARVRVAATVADGASVGVVLGGQVLLGGTAAPAVGLYAQVAAGTQPLQVTVDGVALVLPDAVLAAGGDHTLLVSGTAAAPRADWIADDNRPATDATRARLRLVHGIAGVPGALSLTADFVPVADGVAPATASAYADVAATTTGRLAVGAAGLATPLFSAIEQRLAAGAVYTVFMAGSAAAPVGIVRQDR